MPENPTKTRKFNYALLATAVVLIIVVSLVFALYGETIKEQLTKVGIKTPEQANESISQLGETLQDADSTLRDIQGSLP
ncbi:MAG: hypothetical protein HYS80_02660 [Candidatus Aenigmarchaeota archaeon]|nr:hypothetical protein [Candidatus Aenigmarchaeota archaeon]